MFVSIEEIYTHLYPESIKSISGEDERDLEFAVSVAVGEIKGHLHAFDLVKLFGAQGEDRDPYLLGMVKNVAVWHYIVKANPNIHYNDRLYRYEMTKKDLVDIQNGKIIPDFPAKEDEQGNEINVSGILVNSNPRKEQHI